MIYHIFISVVNFTHTISAHGNKFKWNSKSLGTAKIVDAGTVVLNERGYYNLSNDFKELAGATLVIVSYYYEIKPVSAISIYCSGYNCYVFGLPNTTIAGLRVRYWQ